MRLVFYGSGSFAVPSLEALCDHGYEVQCVVTQPDRPRGRGLALSPPPVKTTALARGRHVMQPTSIRAQEFLDQLRAFSPEIQVVASYGRILPPPVFELPPLGTLNVHASLLPRHRGAAPIQWAIASGDSETGVSIMRIDEGLDTGPVYLSTRTLIESEETTADLEPRLARLGADLLIQALAGIASGRLTPLPQDHSQATLAPALRKDDAPLDWSLHADVLARRIRAFRPWPGSTTTMGDRTIRILRAHTAAPGADPPGTVVALDRDGFVVACGQCTRLRILEVQPESRRPMSANSFAAGTRVRAGFRFGSHAVDG